MIAAFTGHRPDKLSSYVRQYAEAGVDPLEQILKQLKPERVITGMAQGIDMLGLHAAKKLGIPITAAIPWINHGRTGSWEDRVDMYIERLGDCDRHVVVCEGDDYKPWFYQKRNEWMVDNSDQLIAVWDGSNGGTKNCVMYARKVGKPIWYYNWNDGTWAQEYLK